VKTFDLAAGQQRQTWKAHEKYVYALELSADGKTLASLGDDARVHIWEMDTGKSLGDFEGYLGRQALGGFSRAGDLMAVRGKQGDAILWDWKNKKRVCTIKSPVSPGGVAVSPDGRMLAVGGNDAVVVWSVASKKELFSLKSFRAWHVRFSPDGKTLAATPENRGAIHLLDVATGQQRAAIKAPLEAFYDFRYSADGKLMATGSDTGVVKLWDADTGKPAKVFKGDEGAVSCVAYSADSQTLASAGGEGGAPGFALLRDLGTGKVRARLKGHTGPVTALCYGSAGNTIATASRDKTIRLWDATRATGGATRAPLASLRGHTLAVNCVAFAQGDKLLASGGADNTVNVWDLADAATRQKVSPKFTVEGHAGPVLAIAFSPDGKLLASAGADENVIVWDPIRGKKLVVLQGHFGPVRAVKFSRNGWTLASAASISQGANVFGEIKLWDVPAPGADWPVAAKLTFRGHDGAISTLVFAPDGYSLVSASDDGRIKLWDAETGQEYADIRAGRAKVACVAFAPDGTSLATAGADGTVKVWDGTAGKPRNPTPGHIAGLKSVAFAPDGAALATAGDDGTVRIWDAVTGRERSVLRGHAGQIFTVAYSADGKTLASGGADRTVRLWDAKTGKWLRTLVGDNGRVMCLNFSADGKWLAAGDGLTVKLWTLDTKTDPRTLKGHKAEVICVAFHPNSKVLASVSYSERDGVKLWDIDGGKEFGTIQHHYARSAGFSPNGRELATTGDRGTILWDFALQEHSRILKPDINSATIAYRNDGKGMALCLNGPLVSLCNPDTGIKIKDISVGPLNTAPDVAFSPDGRYIATVNTNGTAFILRLAPAPKR
jgi:WD40 repeat protein